MSLMKAARSPVSLCLFLGLSACATVEVAAPPVEVVAPPPPPETPPSLMATPVRFVRVPTLAQLAAYSCSLGTTDPGERQDCLDVFGPPPSYSTLNFQIATTLTVHNPRDTPLPLSAVRILFKLFPDERDEAVATLCLRLFPPEDHTCTGAVPPDSCNASDAPVRRAEPAVARGIPSLLI